METLRAMMLNILVMIFLTTLLDFLLPEGSLRGYVKMTMGFFCGADLIAASYAASQSRSYVGTMAAYNAGDSYGGEFGCG